MDVEGIGVHSAQGCCRSDILGELAGILRLIVGDGSSCQIPGFSYIEVTTGRVFFSRLHRGDEMVGSRPTKGDCAAGSQTEMTYNFIWDSLLRD